MTTTALLVGGSGRTGLRTLRQLLDRGVEVRAVVRTASKLPASPGPPCASAAGSGEVSGYELHEGLVNGLYSPGSTRMANVAHLLCELATDRGAWAAWKGKLPVITDRCPAGQAPSRSAA